MAAFRGGHFFVPITFCKRLLEKYNIMYEFNLFF